MKIVNYVVPLTLVSAYRCIPPKTRFRLFGGPSTSHLAVIGLRNGEGWSAVRNAMLMQGAWTYVGSGGEKPDWVPTTSLGSFIAGATRYFSGR